MGLKIIHIPETNSTNHVVHDLLSSGNSGGELLVSTDYQTSGRGRGDHSWYSSPGKNLLFSWLIHPAFLSASRQFYLSKVVSIAMAELLEQYTGSISVKWPNDLMAGDRKIGGILIEVTVAGMELKHAICGIGINVNEPVFPDFPYPASSLLLETGREYNREELLGQAVERLTDKYRLLHEGREAILDRQYLNRLYKAGDDSLFKTDEDLFRGRICGTDEYGRLQIETENEGLRIFDYGDVHMVFER
ncbi:MAG: biotin--[acetyl-CoA-carboxylase] ligase [Bacteroidota bacterium]